MGALNEVAAKLQNAANEVASVDLSDEKEQVAEFLAAVANSLSTISGAIQKAATDLRDALNQEAPVDPEEPAAE